MVFAAKIEMARHPHRALLWLTIHEPIFPKVSLRLRGKVYTCGLEHVDFKRNNDRDGLVIRVSEVLCACDSRAVTEVFCSSDDKLHFRPWMTMPLVLRSQAMGDNAFGDQVQHMRHPAAGVGAAVQPNSWTIVCHALQ